MVENETITDLYHDNPVYATCLQELTEQVQKMESDSADDLTSQRLDHG